MGISKKIKQKIVILIPLSGGLDSTFVAYKALEEGYTILPIYMTLKNTNISKHTIERQQSKKIHSLLKEEFKTRVLDIKEFEGNPAMFYSQFDIWVDTIKNNVDLDTINFIQFGPTKSDIDSSDDEEIYSRLESANLSLQNKVQFPILKFTKEDISKILPQKYQEEVYTCELPLYYKSSTGDINIEQCGKCNACHLHKTNKMNLSGPFKFAGQLEEEELKQNNNDHHRHIRFSNFYSQQDLSKDIFALV